MVLQAAQIIHRLLGRWIKFVCPRRLLSLWF